MERTHLFIGLSCFLLVACNSNIDKKSSQFKASEIQTEENQQPERSISEGDFLIQDKGAGIFHIGNAIPTSLEGFTIVKEQQIRMTEEGPSEETVFIVNDEAVELLHILPAIDYNTGKTTGDIGELRIGSAIYKTPEGIGVGSSLEEFIGQYPDYKIWYTYVSNRYVVEADKVEAQFLLKEKDFVGDMEVTSAMTPLTKEDFKEGARISLVRIIP